MKKLNKIDGVISAIDIDNIDTDMIIPKQFWVRIYFMK